MKKTIFATLVVLCSAASPAATAIIDFEPLKHEDTFNTNLAGKFYTEDGFLITLIGGNNLTTFGTLGERFSGSTALFNNTTNGVTKLTREDGGSFDLNAIDIAELDGDFEVSVTFGGILSGGGSVTQLFTLALDGHGAVRGLDEIDELDGPVDGGIEVGHAPETAHDLDEVAALHEAVDRLVFRHHSHASEQRVVVPDRLIEHRDRSVGHVGQSCDHSEQGGLAGAVGAE